MNLTEKNPNLKGIMTIAEALHDFIDAYVLLGGATIGFYLTDPSVGPSRVTKDIDLTIDLKTKKDFYQNEEQLKNLGFYRKPEEGPICRWFYEKDGIEFMVDIMPIDEKAIGFSNKWYEEGFNHAVKRKLPNGITIRIFNETYLLATKMEAFNSRGDGDFTHHDMEDIVTLINGCPDIEESLKNASTEVVGFIKTQFERFLKNEDFNNLLPGLIFEGDNSYERAELVKEKMRKIISA